MSIREELNNRIKTYHGIYSDVGIVLDKFSTQELVDYYINELKLEGNLRYFLEQEITANEISKEKTITQVEYYESEMDMWKEVNLMITYETETNERQDERLMAYAEKFKEIEEKKKEEEE